MEEKEKNIILQQEQKQQKQMQDDNKVKTNMQQYIVVEWGSQPALFFEQKKYVHSQVHIRLT